MPFHLCLHFGVIHPDYLLKSLSASQLLDWERYHAQFGLSPDRSDIYPAMQLASFASVHGKDRPKPTDFLVWNKVDPEDEYSDEVIEQALAIYKAEKPTYQHGSDCES